MTTSLYELSVASYLQTLGSAVVVMQAGKDYCETESIALDDIVEKRLHPDMLPFRFQALSVVHHSVGALDALRNGVFSPPAKIDPLDYTELHSKISDAVAMLEAVDADEINAFAGKSVTFKMPGIELPFTSENFIMSFSLPNLHFHATTLYDILRMTGVPLGKKHYLGKLRLGS